MSEKYMPLLQNLEIADSRYRALVLPLTETAGWQEGSIIPADMTDAEVTELGTAVLKSIVAVADDQLSYSDCTDGRHRESLADSQNVVPVREKLVGADTVTAFTMAEALGEEFYGPELNTAPVAERIITTVNYLKANGIMPATHLSCGAAGGLVAVTQNIVKFASQANFVARQRQFVAGFDETRFQQTVANLERRLSDGLYDGYDDAMITDAVQTTTGNTGIAVYADDGRGVHGHVEAMIVRLQNFEGSTVDTNRLADTTNGAQVFVINNNRLENLAKIMSKGSPSAYLTALTAGEAFTDAGHGTLAKNIRTMVVSRLPTDA